LNSFEENAKKQARHGVTRGPRTLKISWESPNVGWKTEGPGGTSYDVVGCASGRETFPVPIAPGNNRVEDGIRFLGRIDSLE